MFRGGHENDLRKYPLNLILVKARRKKNIRYGTGPEVYTSGFGAL
jgi:hypothetical protein